MRAAEQKFDQDVRHLMRSLTDPRRLRSNRLARALEHAGDDQRFLLGVQDVVRAALPAGSRMAQIFERCDVLREPQKAVAAQLALSMRQFYRERAQAQVLIREAIRTRLHASVQEDGDDLLADELELLHELVQCGRIEPALRRAEELMRGGVPAEFGRRLVALRACAFAVSGRGVQAAAELQSLERAGTPRLEGDVESEFAHASALAAQGRHAEAIPHAERAVAPQRPWPEVSERRRRAHARRLALLGTLYREDHEPHKAIAALELAGRILLSCRVTPQTQLARLSAELAMCCFAIADMVDYGTARAIEAYRAATWHGLEAERVRAEIVLGFAALAGGSTGAVLDGLPQTAYGVIAGVEGHWLGRMHLLVSRLLAARGDGAGALASAQTARVSIPPDHCLHALADLRTAEALNAAGSPGDALPLALGAIPRMSLGGGSHHAGSAHVATAEALDRLGDARGARAHCDAGLERMRRGALVMDLARALRLAARLTGNPRYVEEQRALIAG